MPDKILYSTTARATGGRDGSARSGDGNLDVRLATPRELGGPGGEGTNPEQLFAAGYAACFLSALKLIARQAGSPLPDDASVTGTVGIGPDGAGFGLQVSLAVDVPGLDKATAEQLVAKAHEVCPYSNATRNNIEVALSVS